MPMFGTPIAASRREPARAVRLPEGVRLAIIEMVETGADFIIAAKSNGVAAQTMRRWLGRAECISFLRKERARFRAAVCAQNEFTLAQIRDDCDGNQMARVRAVECLERLDVVPSRAADLPSPGIVLKIVNVVPQSPIDITPKPVQIIDSGER